MTITITKVLSLGCACAMLVACGSDDPPENEKQTGAGTLNSAVAASAATQVIGAVAQLNGGAGQANGQSAASSLVGVGALAALTMVTPSGGGAAAPQGAEGVGSVGQADGAGCACTANSCTFTGCGAGTGYLIDGTMSWANNHLVCDLKVSGNAQNFTWDYTEKCDITMTATSIDGTLSSTGSYKGSAQGYNLETSWDSDLNFHAVQYDATRHCPNSGSLDASATLTSQGNTYSGSGTVTFPAAGGGC